MSITHPLSEQFWQLLRQGTLQMMPAVSSNHWRHSSEEGWISHFSAESNPYSKQINFENVTIHSACFWDKIYFKNSQLAASITVLLKLSRRMITSRIDSRRWQMLSTRLRKLTFSPVPTLAKKHLDYFLCNAVDAVHCCSKESKICLFF